MPEVQRITRTGQFLTTVSEVTSLSPRMRRITLTAPEIALRDWPLGCDIAIVLEAEDGREVRRRYTVRSVTDDRLVIDAVLHGHGPGSTRAVGLTTGDEVTFFGPRGEVPVTDADWVLAIADEAGLPAVAAVAEALPGPIRVLAEIADGDEHYPLPTDTEVTWLLRGDRPAGSAEIFLAALDGVAPGAGSGYAYVLGESRAAVAVRDALGRLGLDRSSVYAKGYWNLNSRSTH
ncbi:MAG TPA: siderophore-interacting protein [Jatrophihabitans sp.]|jgi:NADPH-dependent ferric siderophore reductase